MIILYQDQETYDAMIDDLNLAPAESNEDWQGIVEHIQNDTAVTHAEDGRIAQFCVISDVEEQWLHMYIEGLVETGIIPYGGVSLMESIPADWQWNSILSERKE